MTGQLDLFTAPPPPKPVCDGTNECCAEHHEPDCCRGGGLSEPPKRTQMVGPLPGTTWHDAFGGDTP